MMELWGLSYEIVCTIFEKIQKFEKNNFLIIIVNKVVWNEIFKKVAFRAHLH